MPCKPSTLVQSLTQHGNPKHCLGAGGGAGTGNSGAQSRSTHQLLLGVDLIPPTPLNKIENLSHEVFLKAAEMKGKSEKVCLKKKRRGLHEKKIHTYVYVCVCVCMCKG